ncbi:MAG: response regulator transcription factor [Proteobacteria bacterium]|nr:response regulator transcription factor [Pseudomonadota bacterium]
MTRRSVLVVEDHPATLEVIARILATKFDVIGKVGGGAAALDVAEDLKPDLVVLDISLPMISGIEIARILRKKNPSAKIVFVTVHNDPDFLSEALDAGGLGYVLKPRMASDLVRALNEASLGRRFISSVLLEN